jgi:uncharacterized protein (DUF2236 family)
MKKRDVVPHQDYGFFGPDSVTWKVWGYPTSATVGFQRAVVVEELDPALVAAVDQTQGIYDRPRTRYDRTLRYFAMCAFAGSHETMKAADVLVKIHSKGIGTEPYSGQPYDANDPKSQLWIHLTGWHSILYAYEKYGPGKLSATEEEQYWAECARCAELQTCDPADVPRNREELRAYYEEMQPHLSGSDLARKAMNHLLQADVMLPPLPRVLSPLTWLVSRTLRTATIATMPHWMRDQAGIKQSRLLDVAIVPVMKLAFRLVNLHPRVKVSVLGLISPMTVPVVAPIAYGVPPVTSEVLTMAEARERYGFDRPRAAHLDLRSKQAQRVFGEHVAPSDEGLIESEPVLGRLA